MRWFLGVSSTNDETGGGKGGGNVGSNGGSNGGGNGGSNGGSNGEVKCGSSSHLIASDCLTGRLTDCLPHQVKCGSSSHRNDARSGLDLPNKVTFERRPDLPNKDPSEADTRSWQERLCCCLQPTQLQVATVAVNVGAVNMGADGTTVTIAPAATVRSAAASGHAGAKGGATAGAGAKGGGTAGAGAAKGGGTAGAAKGGRGSEGRGARGSAAPATAPEGHAMALDAAKRCNERFDWAGARAALAPWTHQHDARTLIERTICNLQVTKPP